MRAADVIDSFVCYMVDVTDGYEPEPEPWVGPIVTWHAALILAVEHTVVVVQPLPDPLGAAAGLIRADGGVLPTARDSILNRRLWLSMIDSAEKVAGMMTFDAILVPHRLNHFTVAESFDTPIRCLKFLRFH